MRDGREEVKPKRSSEQLAREQRRVGVFNSGGWLVRGDE